MTGRSGIRSALALAILLAIIVDHALAQIGVQEIDPDQPVALVADQIEYDNNTGRVVASGSVEVFYGDRTLTADRIIYDRNTDRIEADGNIILRDSSGATVYADIAEIDAQLRDGIVEGARSVLQGQGKLSAAEARRIDQRYNALSKAVYSPCRVCQESPTPLWRIRARRVIHDEEEKVIHYENATLDFLGVPIAWTPYLSHPDPTVDRATGFLVPSFRQSGNFGFSTKLPYYVVIDDQSDITLTPFITTGEGLIGEAEYRRAFSNGFLSFGGSLTHSDFTGGDEQFEGHLDTSGLFKLESGTRVGWDILTTTDDAYLRFFDFSNVDRLTSEIFAFQYKTDGFFDVSGVRFQSLRDDEPAGEIPLVLPEIQFRQEFPDPFAGGEFGFFADSYGLTRNNGVDVGRISLGSDWERNWILPVGLSVTAFGELRGDLFVLGDEFASSTDSVSTRFAPLGGLELRYPLVWDEASGASHVVEPIAQAIIAPFGGNGPDIPNEDSILIEFDETNLFSRSHFSGIDGFEEGPRFNLGMRYERYSNDGLDVDAVVGRVFRFEDADEFSEGSGLFNAQSDWVGAWGFGYTPYLRFRQRMRVDDEFTVTRNEVTGTLAYANTSLESQYIFLEKDPEIGAFVDREELSSRLQTRVDRNWSFEGFLQRDLELAEFVEAGGSVTYENECCKVDLFVRRRFTSSTDVPASTSVGVQIRLLTLGTDALEEDQ